MKKKQLQQEEQRRQEDRALTQGMLWVAGAVVLELLLFLVNRYAFNFDATSQGVAVAEGLRAALRTMRVLGAVMALSGVALTVVQLKQGGKGFWSMTMTAVGVVLMVCAHVVVKYQGSGLRMLYLLVPVLGGLALSYYIYTRDFFLSALPGVAAVLGLWFVRISGICLELGLTVLAGVAVLALVLMLKQGDGVVTLAGKQLRFLEVGVNYAVPLASAVAALAVQVLGVVAGAAVAYYLIFAMGAWMFALLVYYTVKML